MKIKEITEDYILFDNGNKITYDHEQDCCENNYADFGQLDDLALDEEFDENLEFEAVEESGFRFGNQPNKMYFVPCYSCQNGYDTDELGIYYKNEIECHFSCEFVVD